MTPIARELLAPSLAPFSRSNTLPAGAYNNPSVLRWEQEHFFDRSWACVGRAAGLERAGDQRAVSLGREFIAVTRHVPAEAVRKTALRGVTIATIILLAFVLIGQLLLSVLDIELGAFRIAGSLVLLLISLRMVLESTHHTEERGEGGYRHDVAVFPLATPSIADPGAILAVVLLTDHTLYSVPQQVGTTLVMLGGLALQYVLLLVSGTVNRVLGATGTNVISCIMGLILASLAIETIVVGIRAAFALV